MKKFTLWGALFSALILNGCHGALTKSTGGALTGDNPPNVTVEIDGKTYQTILGSYCWGNKAKKEAKCVDTVGLEDLLKDKKPVQVQSGEQIIFKMNYTPKPNKIHLVQMSNGNLRAIELTDDYFIAPDKKGTYLYDYEVWWMDEKSENLSHGSASYALSIKVR